MIGVAGLIFNAAGCGSAGSIAAGGDATSTGGALVDAVVDALDGRGMMPPLHAVHVISMALNRAKRVRIITRVKPLHPYQRVSSLDQMI